MFLMAGFKRTNIQGHTVVADPVYVKLVRRKSSHTIGQLFREAQEHGQTRIELNGEPFIVLLHSDHTFTIKADIGHHNSL